MIWNCLSTKDCWWLKWKAWENKWRGFIPKEYGSKTSEEDLKFIMGKDGFSKGEKDWS